MDPHVGHTCIVALKVIDHISVPAVIDFLSAILPIFKYWPAISALHQLYHVLKVTSYPITSKAASKRFASDVQSWAEFSL